MSGNFSETSLSACKSRTFYSFQPYPNTRSKFKFVATYRKGSPFFEDYQREDASFAMDSDQRTCHRFSRSHSARGHRISVCADSNHADTHSIRATARRDSCACPNSAGCTRPSAAVQHAASASASRKCGITTSEHATAASAAGATANAATNDAATSHAGHASRQRTV